jgi:hypothetical protein
LISFTWVYSKPDGEFNGFVEFRKRDLFDFRDSLFEVVLPARLELFSRGIVFLSVLFHFLLRGSNEELRISDCGFRISSNRKFTFDA